MSKSNAHETEYLAWLLQKDDPTWVAVNNFYLSLHTANPNEGGDQSTNEVSYTGYSRVALDRQAAGDFDVTGNVGDNNALVQFGICTAGGGTVTHWGLGTDASGAGELLHWAALDTPLAIAPPIRPQFDPGDIRITED